jgi:hypothetical protein
MFNVLPPAMNRLSTHPTERLSEFSSEVSKLQEALSKLLSGESLSVDEINKLIEEFPDLEDSLTIDSRGVISLNTESIQNIIDSMKRDFDIDFQNQIGALQLQLDMQWSLYDSATSDEDRARINEVINSLYAQISMLESLNSIDLSQLFPAQSMDDFVNSITRIVRASNDIAGDVGSIIVQSRGTGFEGGTDEIVRQLSVRFDIDAEDITDDIRALIDRMVTSDSTQEINQLALQIDNLLNSNIELANQLGQEYEIAILSGDVDRARQALNKLTNAVENGEISIEEYNRIVQFSKFSLQELHDSLNAIQAAYNSVSKALDELNEFGEISIDTYQELLKLEPQYLGMLINEQGELDLTQESLEAVTRARIDEMAQKQISTVLGRMFVDDAIIPEEEALAGLIPVINETSESLADLNKELLTSLALEWGYDSEAFQRILSYIEAIEKLRDKASADLGSPVNRSRNNNNRTQELKDASFFIERLNDLYRAMLKIDEQISQAENRRSIADILGDNDGLNKSNRELIELTTSRIRLYEDYQRQIAKVRRDIQSEYSEFSGFDVSSEESIARERQRLENQAISASNAGNERAESNARRTLERFNRFVASMNHANQLEQNSIRGIEDMHKNTLNLISQLSDGLIKQIQDIPSQFKRSLDEIESAVDNIQLNLSIDEFNNQGDAQQKATSQLIALGKQRKAILQTIVDDTREAFVEIQEHFSEFASIDMSNTGAVRLYDQGLLNDIRYIEQRIAQSTSDSERIQLESERRVAQERLFRFREWGRVSDEVYSQEKQSLQEINRLKQEQIGHLKTLKQEYESYLQDIDKAYEDIYGGISKLAERRIKELEEQRNLQKEQNELLQAQLDLENARKRTV